MKKNVLLQHLYQLHFSYQEVFYDDSPVDEPFIKGFCYYLFCKGYDESTIDTIVNELYSDLHIVYKLRANMFDGYFFSTLEKSNFKETSLKPRIQLLEKTIKRIEKLVQLDSVTII